MFKIKFGLLGSNDIENYSAFKVTSSEATELGGILDPRFGGKEGAQCIFCKKPNQQCSGHFGHLQLHQPMFNWAFINNIKQILSCICLKTSQVLIPKTSNYSSNSKKRFMQIYQDCITLQDVPKLIIQGKNGMINLIIEYPNKSNLLFPMETTDTTSTKNKYQQIITADYAYKILSNISEDDQDFLGISNPEKMMILNFLIPPMAIRPSLKSNFIDGSSEHGLTHKLSDIVKFNDKIRSESKKISNKYYKDYLTCLQYHLATYYDNESNLLPRSEMKSGSFTRGIRSNIQGKNGRMRRNLQGKRVDFSARSVITSDPNTKINEIGVPVKIAMTITFPEIVTMYNIYFLQDLIKNGTSTYPGANFVQTNEKTFVDLKIKKNINLQVNWIVHRHLLNGDTILFNRQPTLHKMSMMAHRVYVINNPSLMTFRLNVTATTPYNADFDGDEMNLFAPQSYASSTEINLLANIKKYILSPRDSMPIIKIKQDAIIGCYMLTHLKLNFDWKTVMNLLSYTSITKNNIKKINYTGLELLHLINSTSIAYLDDIQSLINALFMLHTSFTVGLSDAIMSEDLQKEVEQIIKSNSTDINTIVSELLMEKIDLSNNLKFQIVSGAKGKPSNLGMISACLGQSQTNVQLPYESTNNPGFITSSYIKGLSFPEFIYHNIDGRNGMIDTAINTAITGYMQRKTIKAMEDVYVCYDLTVRDESNQIVQFIYGDNGYDPIYQEINISEIIKKHLSSTSEELLTRESIISKLEILFSPEYTLLFPMEIEVYRDHKNYRNKMDQHHKQLLRQAIIESFTECHLMSAQQLENIIQELSLKFNELIVQPGEMVGITAAQSLGEPLTQFTLNTFHSTGLSGITEQMNSMSRFSEITGFSKTTKNSIFKLYIKDPSFIESFISFSLQEHCETAEIIYTEEVNIPWMFKFNLKKNVPKIILEQLLLKCKGPNITKKQISQERGLIIIKLNFKNCSLEKIMELFDSILQFKFSGIDLVSIDSNWVILRETTLSKLCNFFANEIDWSSVESNDLYSIYVNYGIEATRTAIIEELTKLYEANKTFINYQHISLIADKMTYTGTVQPLNRYGIKQFDPHVLSRASFEKTMEQFIEAAIFEEEDPIESVSSRISLGKVFKGGTGLVDIIMEDEAADLFSIDEL